jgi:hypothetical protein
MFRYIPLCLMTLMTSLFDWNGGTSAILSVQSTLRLLNEVLCRRAQTLRTPRLLNANISAFDARIGAGLAWLAASTTDLANLARVTGTFSHN